MAEQEFTGFRASALALLRDLAKNNERAWFTPRKDRFEADLFNPLRALVEDTSAALGKARIPIRGDAKRSTFRIYRDVRFSPDKSPYKTHVSAYLSYDGEKHTPGGLYIHVQPKQSFCAVAFYGIEKPLLARWRAEMATNPGAFRKMLKALERNGLSLDGPGDFEDALKRMPRGFEALADSDIASYFRLHSFVVRKHLNDKELASPDLVRELVTLAKNAKPLLEYGWALV